MQASTLALTSLVFAGLGLVLGVTGWSLALIMNIPKSGGFKLRKNELAVKVSYRCILGGGFSLGIAVVAIISAGLWWGVSLLFAELTPGTLALFSIVLGPAPLLITALASGMANILGCSVDASGARNCVFSGLDLGPLLHSLFMTYWLVFLTAGLAFFGLMGSGIWALVKLL